MEPLGVIILGAGDRGEAHVKAWKTVPGVTITEVVDINENRAYDLALSERISQYSTDWEKAVYTTGAHIVSIALPTCLHADVAVAAAEGGRHIFCEKPIALTVADAQRIIQAVRQHGVQMAFCFQRRRQPVFHALAELVQGGAIGRPLVHLQAQAVEIRPKTLMHDKHGNGGPLIDGWCHYVDIMRMVFGSNPARVVARGFTFAEGHPTLADIKELAVDTASVIVDFASGDIMSATWSWGMPKGLRVPLPGQTLLGPEGVLIPRQNGIRWLRSRGRETTIECEPVSSADATAAIARDLASWVRGEGESDITPEEALIALKTSLAALKSIETGLPIVIDRE